MSAITRLGRALRRPGARALGAAIGGALLGGGTPPANLCFAGAALVGMALGLHLISMRVAK